MKKKAANVKHSGANKKYLKRAELQPAKKTPSRETVESVVQKDLARAMREVPAIRQTIEEEAIARKYVLARYRALINRKYLDGLSSQEKEELDRLQLTLDDMDGPFYDAVIKRLRAVLEGSIVT